MAGIYTSGEGEKCSTEIMNSFRLVNGLIKNIKELEKDPINITARENVDALSAEILARLDPRGK